MPKRSCKLAVRIPPYAAPRNRWRRQIHEVVLAATQTMKIKYRDDDRLELRVRLYLDTQALSFHDVDNRLKDIMDSLQGRVGGAKSKRELAAIIPNDRQVFRVTVEKQFPPKQSGGAGHLMICKYVPSIRERRCEHES